MLYRKTFTPSNEDLVRFGNNVTGAGPWNSITPQAPDGLAHQISIRNDSVTNHSAKTITLIGTDADGRAQTEQLAAPNTSATVESTKYFLTLTQTTISASIGADTFDIGFVDEIASETIPLAWRLNAPSNWLLDVTGVINVSVEFCVEDPFAAGGDQNNVQWVRPNANLDAETTDSTAAQQVPAGYWGARLVTASYSPGAAVKLVGSQPETGCS